MIAFIPNTGLKEPRAAWLEVVTWGAYLACSWTWCIGMFLPVLLVRDYGVWGWVVFAVPNVIGAAAMGWVLREGMSERIVARHIAAIECFRLVTVVFQLWFLVVYLGAPMGNNLVLTPDGVRAAVVVALLAGVGLGADRRLGIVAWAVSIGCAVFAYSRGGLRWPEGSAVSADVLWLAPVCTFGFALCPYLDPTFHQARQAMKAGTARGAFAIGFGVLFLAMIVLTLLYSDWARVIAANAGGLAAAGAVFIAVHVGMQLTYTCTVHARATPGRGAWSPPRIGFAMLAAGAAAVATMYAPDYAGLSGREIVYRAFMSFYGLVFPAYVWLCMIPRGAGREMPRRSVMRIFWLTVGIAAPFFWLGFMERQEVWLAPGLMVVLLARLLVRPRDAGGDAA